MLPGLEPCIARYYDVWLSYSRYICAQYGVLNEACDVVGDVMEDLCRKSDAVLADFLHEESQGNKKLRNYVKRMIQFKAIDAANAEYGLCRPIRMLFGAFPTILIKALALMQCVKWRPHYERTASLFLSIPADADRSKVVSISFSVGPISGTVQTSTDRSGKTLDRIMKPSNF